jgi:hypothetical protein
LKWPLAKAFIFWPPYVRREKSDMPVYRISCGHDPQSEYAEYARRLLLARLNCSVGAPNFALVTYTKSPQIETAFIEETAKICQAQIVKQELAATRLLFDFLMKVYNVPFWHN